MLVLVDNRDSFTFNLVQALAALGEEVEVVRGAETSAADVLARAPERVVIGPGPGGPAEAGASLALYRAEHDVPILGVCLGLQCLAHAFGGRVVSARRLVHGSVVPVHHGGTGLFRGIPSPADFMRYNSLAADTDVLPACLDVTATSEEGDVMALRHRTRPLAAVQFHPESFLSEHGSALLANFLAGSGEPRGSVATPQAG